MQKVTPVWLKVAKVWHFIPWDRGAHVWPSKIPENLEVKLVLWDLVAKPLPKSVTKIEVVIEVQFLTFHFLTPPFFGFRHTKWLLVKENNENRSDIAFWKILTRNMDHSRHLPTKNSQDINNKSMLENGHSMSKVHFLSKKFFF